MYHILISTFHSFSVSICYYSSTRDSNKPVCDEAGALVQWLWACTAFSGDLSSVPSTQSPIPSAPEAPILMYMAPYRDICIHIILKTIKFFLTLKKNAHDVVGQMDFPHGHTHTSLKYHLTSLIYRHCRPVGRTTDSFLRSGT